MQVAVTRKKLVANASDRSAETSAPRDRPTNERELVTQLDKRDECRWKPVTRRTTRYDYEVKLGFVPPDWEHLSARFARRRLVPAAPQCYTLVEEALAGQPPYRLVATAYHRGSIAQRAPRTLPSRVAVDAQFAPTNESPEACEAILRAATGKKRGFGSPNIPPTPDEEERGLFPQCSRDQQLRSFRRERGEAFFEDDAGAKDRDGDEADDVLPFDAD